LSVGKRESVMMTTNEMFEDENIIAGRLTRLIERCMRYPVHTALRKLPPLRKGGSGITSQIITNLAHIPLSASLG
jgi:hypothetical protein